VKIFANFFKLWYNAGSSPVERRKMFNFVIALVLFGVGFGLHLKTSGGYVHQSRSAKIFVQILLLVGTINVLHGVGNFLDTLPAVIVGNGIWVGFLVWMLWFSPWAKPVASTSDFR